MHNILVYKVPAARNEPKATVRFAVTPTKKRRPRARVFVPIKPTTRSLNDGFYFDVVRASQGGIDYYIESTVIGYRLSSVPYTAMVTRRSYPPGPPSDVPLDKRRSPYTSSDKDV